MAVDDCGSGSKLLVIFALVVACLLPFAPFFLHVRSLSLHPIFFPISIIVAVPIIVIIIYSVLRCGEINEELRRERAERRERRRLYVKRRDL